MALLPNKRIITSKKSTDKCPKLKGIFRIGVKKKKKVAW
jgi:hypothetical protein